MTKSMFRFRGAQLCLDFVATLTGRYREPVEQLLDPDALGTWVVAVGLIEEKPGIKAAEVRQARELREAIYRLVHPATRDHVDPRDIGLVNYWASEGVPYPQLGANGQVVTFPTVSPTRSCLAMVARDTVTMLGRGLDNVRECESPDCSVLYVDMSQSGRRRWCDMTRCGNQMKAVRHRRRAVGRSPAPVEVAATGRPALEE